MIERVTFICRDKDWAIPYSVSPLLFSWTHFCLYAKKLIDQLGLNASAVSVYIPPKCNFPVQGEWTLYQILPPTFGEYKK